MEFIQEVVIKSSGFEAEHGGALGGVINVIQKRGSNAWHGSIFTSYQGDSLDSAPTQLLRRDPATAPNAGGQPFLDQTAQFIQPKKDHYRYWDPGFEVGGDLFKDRLWVFLSTVPRLESRERTVNLDCNPPLAPFRSLASAPFLKPTRPTIHWPRLRCSGHRQNPSFRLLAVQLRKG